MALFGLLFMLKTTKIADKFFYYIIVYVNKFDLQIYQSKTIDYKYQYLIRIELINRNAQSTHNRMKF
mgnify:CR=1 FL=1